MLGSMPDMSKHVMCYISSDEKKTFIEAYKHPVEPYYVNFTNEVKRNSKQSFVFKSGGRLAAISAFLTNISQTTDYTFPNGLGTHQTTVKKKIIALLCTWSLILMARLHEKKVTETQLAYKDRLDRKCSHIYRVLMGVFGIKNSEIKEETYGYYGTLYIHWYNDLIHHIKKYYQQVVDQKLIEETNNKKIKLLVQQYNSLSTEANDINVAPYKEFTQHTALSTINDAVDGVINSNCLFCPHNTKSTTDIPEVVIKIIMNYLDDDVNYTHLCQMVAAGASLNTIVSQKGLPIDSSPQEFLNMLKAKSTILNEFIQNLNKIGSTPKRVTSIMDRYALIQFSTKEFKAGWVCYLNGKFYPVSYDWRIKYIPSTAQVFSLPATCRCCGKISQGVVEGMSVLCLTCRYLSSRFAHQNDGTTHIMDVKIISTLTPEGFNTLSKIASTVLREVDSKMHGTGQDAWVSFMEKVGREFGRTNLSRSTLFNSDIAPASPNYTCSCNTEFPSNTVSKQCVQCLIKLTQNTNFTVTENTIKALKRLAGCQNDFTSIRNYSIPNLPKCNICNGPCSMAGFNGVFEGGLICGSFPDYELVQLNFQTNELPETVTIYDLVRFFKYLVGLGR
jgi:hypothetical protein